MASSVAEAAVRAKAASLWPDDPRAQAWFVGLAKQESNFDPGAHAEGVPKGGADGLFQFTYDLKKKYGLTPGASINAQLDAAGNYISDLLMKHSGDWHDVIAEHYLGMPKYKRMKSGEDFQSARSFQASHYPRVERNMRKELGFTPTETPPVPKTFRASAAFAPEPAPARLASAPMFDFLQGLLAPDPPKAPPAPRSAPAPIFPTQPRPQFVAPGIPPLRRPLPPTEVPIARGLASELAMPFLQGLW